MEESIVFSDAHSHQIKKLNITTQEIVVISGSEKGYQDGCSAKYNLPGAICRKDNHGL